MRPGISEEATLRIQQSMLRHAQRMAGPPVVTQDRWRDRAIFLAVTRAQEYRAASATTLSQTGSERKRAAADAIENLVKELQEL